MKRTIVTLITVLACLAIGAAAALYFDRTGLLARITGTPPASQPTTTPPKPTGILVTVAPVRRGSLVTPIEMLGAVAPVPGLTTIASLAEEVRVVEVFATPGTAVRQGDPIARVEPSQAARSRIRLADSAVAAAQALVDEASTRVQSRVGTQQEVVQAEQSLRTAQVQLETTRAALPPEDGLLAAPTDGLLNPGFAPVGSLVPAAAAIFEIADTNALAIRFGVPLAQIDRVPVGSSVEVLPLLVADATPVSLSIARFEHAVDPISRTRPAWTVGVSAARFSPGAPILVTAPTQSPEGWLVPRAAITLTDQGPAVFALRDGKAIAISVVILAGNADTVCVEAPELRETDSVITRGAHELEDGTPVHPEIAP